MMVSIRKLLILFVALGFAPTAVGVDPLAMFPTAKGHRSQCQDCPSLPQTPPTPPVFSPWGLCSSFAASLFEPFIEDITQQKERFDQQGIAGYVSTVVATVGEFAINNPSNAMMLGGTLLSGINMPEEGAFLIHLATGAASGLKNFQALWSFANSISKDKELFKRGFYGLTIICALESFIPVAHALTPTFGSQFQINETPLSEDVPLATATLENGNNVIIWKNDGFHIIGRLFFPNRTAVTDEFDVSLTPAFPLAIPSLASLTGGNFAVAWPSGVASILGRIFYPNATAVGAPFAMPQNTTYISITSPSVAGLENGNAFFTWTGITQLGSVFIPGRIFSPIGVPVTSEFNINQAVSSQGGYSSAVSVKGGAWVTWYAYNPSNLLRRFVFSNGTFGSNESVMNQTTLSGYDPTGGAGLPNGNAFIPYQSVSGLVARIIQNQGSLSNEIPIGTGRGDGASVTGLGNNALAVWANAYGGGHVEGKAFGPTGNALTTELSIPGSNPGAFPPSASGSNASALVAWQDAATKNIYGSHVSNGGELAPSWLIWPVMALARCFSFLNWERG